MRIGSPYRRAVLAVVLGIAVAWGATVQAVDNDVGTADGAAAFGSIGGEKVVPVEADPAPVGQPDTMPVSYNASMRYAGSTLRPRADNVSYAVNTWGGCVYVTAGSTSTWFNLPVELPDGALVKYLRMYANDSSASGGCAAYFTVYDLYGNIAEEHGVFSSGSAGNGYWTSDELSVQVDYSTHSYVLHWRSSEIGSSLQLCGFRLYYYVNEIFAHGFEAGGTSGWSSVVN